MSCKCLQLPCPQSLSMQKLRAGNVSDRPSTGCYHFVRVLEILQTATGWCMLRHRCASSLMPLHPERCFGTSALMGLVLFFYNSENTLHADNAIFETDKCASSSCRSAVQPCSPVGYSDGGSQSWRFHSPPWYVYHMSTPADSAAAGCRAVRLE